MAATTLDWYSKLPAELSQMIWEHVAGVHVPDTVIFHFDREPYMDLTMPLTRGL